MDDEAEVLRLDDAWNDAYRRSDRSPLADILAEDFSAVTPTGGAASKASLMVSPPGVVVSIAFSEQGVQLFGETAISRGRLQLELVDLKVDQRFMRVYAKRGGRWQAVSVSVSPAGG
jgi:hypothetical protein